MNVGKTICFAALAAVFACSADVAVPEKWTLEDESVRLEVFSATGDLVLSDKRCGRVWRTWRDPWSAGLSFRSARQEGKSLDCVVDEPKRGRSWRMGLALCGEGEVAFTLAGEGSMDGWICYPFPFRPDKDDRFIVPQQEGMAYPVSEPYEGPKRFMTYCGSNLSMPFYGLSGRDGAGLMAIVETADDASVAVATDPDGRISPASAWEPAGRSCLVYPRRLRIVPLAKGGYVAMAKRYRRYARETGLLKTFEEKAKARPLVRRLPGAVNIWCWDEDKRATVDLLESVGVTHYLWSGGGAPEFVAAEAAKPGVLVGKYDLYHDIYYPALCKEFGMKSGWNTDAWPADVQWYAPDSNKWCTAWALERKDGTMMASAMMCDMCAPPRARKRLEAELKTWRWTSRFVDTTTAERWQVCWNPAHPMTRTQSREKRVELLRVMSEEFRLVTGSERGHDAVVPVCDYFEGMSDISGCEVPRAGRDVKVLYTGEVPEKFLKYMVGERYRIPLWELVYHDCCAAYHYWGGANNKIPSLWRKRDLFDALYGTPPLYIVAKARWATEKDRLAESYALLEPIARETGFSEMLSHEWLADDGSVQRTTFANGQKVTVDFRAGTVRSEK